MSTANTFAGLFFLRSRPTTVRLSAARTAWLFSLMEREPGGGVLHRTAVWSGADAELFVQQHTERLKAGCALRIELERLRVSHEEVTGDVTECELAPERWPERSDAARAALGHAVVIAAAGQTA